MFWFNKKIEVNKDPQAIDRFLNRGVENIYPSKDYLKAKLLSGKVQTVYLGIDPTGTTLHLGHAIVLKKLKEFQDLGHKVILLIGDFTATIGDPTDKKATRKKLTKNEVLENAKNYKVQASTFLKFEGDNPAELKYNSKWLEKLTFADVLELGSLVTVDQMLKRDMFEKRMAEAKPLYIHEIMYPLMQGYDSVAMDVDGEIGGNDQTFNMLMGRDLIKVLKNKEKFVITTKLLTDSAGAKMGKTEGNMVSLDQGANEMFGKVMSWADNLIIPAFELCTYVSEEEISRVKESLEKGENPKEHKVKLAKEIVAVYHGNEKANHASASFERTFSKGETPENVEVIKTKNGDAIIDVIIESGVVKSKSEFKRLVEEGAVSEVGGEAIKTFDYKLEKTAVWKIGKRRFIKIEVK